jgi:glucose-6-phosphate isomerase
MPVLMGLLTVWYTGFFNAHSSAVVPYCQPLEQFPSFLQQLYMESLGKRVDRDGNGVSSNTGEVLWGTVGSNGQHSYFQLFHQGREFIPVDFIATARAGVDEAGEAHRHLLSNCLSQSLALMQGTPDESDPHKQVPGNRPSNTLLLDELNPFNLGSLIALYEHKVYVQSVIWGINAFDQWGVELGKQLSKSLFSALGDDNNSAGLDASSAGLIKQIKQWDTP